MSCPSIKETIIIPGNSSHEGGGVKTMLLERIAGPYADAAYDLTAGYVRDRNFWHKF